MPVHESIAPTNIAKPVERAIPTRVQSTRSQPRPQNLNQPVKTEGAGSEESTPAESVRLSPQVTALARAEQKQRHRELELKKREEALEARLADADKYSQLKTKLDAKDYSAAEELGMTYEDHTKYLIDKQSSEDPQAQAYKALEKEVQDLKKGQEERAAEEYEGQVAEYRTALKSLAESTPEFMRVHKFKEDGPEGKEITGTDVALQFILDEFEEEREVTLEEALKVTDSYLKERAQKWAALIEEPKAEVEAAPKTLPPPKQGSRTLTQQMQPSGDTPRPQKSYQHMSEEERYAEARRRVIERQQQGR